MNRTRKIFAMVAAFTVLASLPFLDQFKSKKTAHQPYLTIIGTTSKLGSTGKQSVELVEALKDDIDVNFKESHKIKAKETPEKTRNIIEDETLSTGKIILYQDCPEEKNCALEDIIKYLTNSDNIRIAYLISESNLISPDWVYSLNTHFDLVAVPDNFLVDVYKNRGVTIPIFELPLSLNLKPFLTLPFKDKKTRPFTFANFDSFTQKNNQLELIKAFYAAFGNSKDVKLRLNAKSGETKYIEDIKEKIHQLGVTNIDFTKMIMDEDFYLKTFQDVDCYVSLSSNKGFSIPLEESMALGIPAILTDNMQQSEICRSGIGCIISSLPGNEIEIKDVVQAFRNMHKDYDHYLTQRLAVRNWAKQYSYGHLKPLYLGLIKPKKIILGDINKITPSCLFTDSEKLCEKFNILLGIPFKDQRTHE